MTNIKILIIFSAILFLAFIICRFIPDANLDSLLQQVILNAISILVGVLIAILGIFLGSISSMYLSIYKLIKTDKKKNTIINDDEIEAIKQGLSGVLQELKENALFTIITFIIVVLLFFFKAADIPYIQWFIDPSIISKNFFSNWLIVSGMLSIFFATIDTTKTIFKINELFELTKE